MIDIFVVGGGASALFFGAFLKNKKYLIAESSSKLAQKLALSGGSKCNITNEFLSSENFTGDTEFIKSALQRFDNKSLLRFLKDSGLYVKRDDRVVEGQYFFESSSKIVDRLKKLQNAKIALNTKITDVIYDEHFIIKSNRGDFKAKNLVVASGGLSYPSLGASSIAYDIATNFKHDIESPKPALVGFTVQKDQFWFKDLSGISLFCTIKYREKKLSGMMLFTHKGFSGPVALNASLYFDRGFLEVDFLPHSSIEKLLKNSNKQITTLLPLPKRFTKGFLNSISVEDKRADSLSTNDIEKLKSIHNYKLSPAGTFGYSRAEITKGGVKTEMIDVSTMQSKLQKNLYFIGEALDVNGELGGYNLQWCTATAFIAASSLMTAKN